MKENTLLHGIHHKQTAASFATTSVELGLFCPYSQLLDHLSSVCMFHSVQLLCIPSPT